MNAPRLRLADFVYGGGCGRKLTPCVLQPILADSAAADGLRVFRDAGFDTAAVIGDITAGQPRVRVQ